MSGSSRESVYHHRTEAWEWLLRQRRHAPHNADIWDLRFHKDKYLDSLWQKVEQGEYRLSPARVFRRPLKGDAIVQWSAQDALVMKWVALEIKSCLPVQERCVHVAGHRGGRDSLRKITSTLSDGARFVWRTDIRGYYRHIRKPMLWAHVCRFVTAPVLQSLIKQYIWYTVEDGGEFYTPPDGICRGSSLSPLLGASYLWYVDSSFTRQENIFYVRYMDDFLFLSQRRWPLRRSVRKLREFFDAAGFECHPDKTQLGRVDKGFDWLGIWFDANGPAGIAPRAIENHHLRKLRLEEQTRRRRLPDTEVSVRVQQYEKRWSEWAERQLSAALPDPP